MRRVATLQALDKRLLRKGHGMAVLSELRVACADYITAAYGPRVWVILGANSIGRLVSLFCQPVAAHAHLTLSLSRSEGWPQAGT